MVGDLNRNVNIIVLIGNEIRFLTILIGMKAAHARPYIMRIHTEFKPKLIINVTSKTATNTRFQLIGLRHRTQP